MKKTIMALMFTWTLILQMHGGAVAIPGFPTHEACHKEGWNRIFSIFAGADSFSCIEVK